MTQKPPRSIVASSVRERYQSAYLVAKVINGAADWIKTAGYAAACIVWILGFSFASRGPSEYQNAFLISLSVFAVIMAFIAYILGTVVAAIGQCLQATLDTAVHTSPFLSNEERAQVMDV